MLLLQHVLHSRPCRNDFARPLVVLPTFLLALAVAEVRHDASPAGSIFKAHFPATRASRLHPRLWHWRPRTPRLRGFRRRLCPRTPRSRGPRPRRCRRYFLHEPVFTKVPRGAKSAHRPTRRSGVGGGAYTLGVAIHHDNKRYEFLSSQAVPRVGISRRIMQKKKEFETVHPVKRGRNQTRAIASRGGSKRTHVRGGGGEGKYPYTVGFNTS